MHLLLLLFVAWALAGGAKEAWCGGSVSKDDVNNDGIVDQIIETDEKNRVISLTVDANKDGTMDTFQYYEAGKIVRLNKDLNDDKKIDLKVFYENGDIIKILKDRDFNDRFEICQKFNRPPWEYVSELDDDGDGVADERTFFKEGNLRRREIIEPGKQRIRIREHYDRKGHLFKMEEDSGGTGRLNLVWFYNDQGAFYLAEKDTNGDNRTDIWFHYQNHRLTAVDEDTNLDGRPDMWEFFNDAVKVIHRKRDLDFDGIADIEESF